MIGRRADKRQAQRYIHAAGKIQRLDRDQGLVVIHADSGIIARACGGVEHRVGGQWAGQIQPLGPQSVQHRGDHFDLLGPHRPAFARMRVQTRNGNARTGNAEIPAQGGMGDQDGVGQHPGGQGCGHIGQRDMDRRGHHTQGVAGQHHHHPVHACQSSQVFRMARIGKTGPVDQRLFVDRGGAQGRAGAARQQINARGNRVNHPLGMGRIGHAGGHGRAKVAGQNGQGVTADRCRIGGGGDDLKPGTDRQMRRIADP